MHLYRGWSLLRTVCLEPFFTSVMACQMISERMINSWLYWNSLVENIDRKGALDQKCTWSDQADILFPTLTTKKEKANARFLFWKAPSIHRLARNQLFGIDPASHATFDTQIYKNKSGWSLPKFWAGNYKFETGTKPAVRDRPCITCNIPYTDL